MFSSKQLFNPFSCPGNSCLCFVIRLFDLVILSSCFIFLYFFLLSFFLPILSLCKYALSTLHFIVLRTTWGDLLLVQ